MSEAPPPDRTEPPPEPTVETTVRSRCASCEAELSGAYCSACGERTLAAEPPSVVSLLRDSARETFHLEGRFLRTLASLVFRPGELTQAYMAGRRTRWMSPVQLFLALNLVYFVVQPYSGYNGFNTPLDSHMSRQRYSESFDVPGRVEAEIQSAISLRTAIDLRLARQETGAAPTAADTTRIAAEAERLERALFPTRFDARGEVFARALVFLIIPMLALALAVVFVDKRRPFVEHLVLATHLHAWALFFVYSIFLFVLRIIVRAGLLAAGALMDMSLSEVAQTGVGRFFGFWVLEMGAGIVVLPYFYFAFRRVYGGAWWSLLIRVMVMAWVTMQATVLFRFILFWITFASVS